MSYARKSEQVYDLLKRLKDEERINVIISTNYIDYPVIKLLRKNSVSKEEYDSTMEILEEDKIRQEKNVNRYINELKDTIDAMDRYKNILLKLIEMTNDEFKEYQEAYNIAATRLNDKYLSTGNTLGKIALRNLDDSDDKIINKIDEALKTQPLTEDEKQGVKDTYMTAVRTERNKGGKRKGKTRKNKRKNKKQ